MDYKTADSLSEDLKYICSYYKLPVIEVDTYGYLWCNITKPSAGFGLVEVSIVQDQAYYEDGSWFSLLNSLANLLSRHF